MKAFVDQSVSIQLSSDEPMASIFLPIFRLWPRQSTGFIARILNFHNKINIFR
jgi:hypothetical protein